MQEIIPESLSTVSADYTVVIVNNDQLRRNEIERVLKSTDPLVRCLYAEGFEDAVRMVLMHYCHMMVTDFFIDGGEHCALELCDQVQRVSPHTRCLIVSNFQLFLERTPRPKPWPVKFVQKSMDLSKSLSGVWGLSLA